MRAFAMILLSAGAVAAEGAPPPGALSCSGCHGAASSLPLDGQSAADMRRALAEFRSGARPATIMPRILAGFTEAELEAIVTWLAEGENG